VLCLFRHQAKLCFAECYEALASKQPFFKKVDGISFVGFVAGRKLFI